LFCFDLLGWLISKPACCGIEKEMYHFDIISLSTVVKRENDL
jgi:hypothetical protein